MSLHHLHSGFFFATSTLPLGFAHHEDLHQLGVGHQLVFKGGKNLVPDQATMFVDVDIFKKHPHLLWVALNWKLVFGLDHEIWRVVDSSKWKMPQRSNTSLKEVILLSFPISLRHGST